MTKILVKWAIQSHNEQVFEPSFGGCGFLQAAKERIELLGAKDPASQLFGCDIDPYAFEILNKVFESNYLKGNFLNRDFLNTVPSDFTITKVNVIIGNPPYVPWHNMLPNQRQYAMSLSNEYSNDLSRKAGLWAYFLLHSLSFLKEDGRMAWILPGSFLHAEYANTIRNILSRKFKRSIAILLTQRLFISEGTEESSVILLCQGYKSNSSSVMNLASCKDTNSLEVLIRNWSNHKPTGKPWIKKATEVLAPTSAKSVFQFVKERNSHFLLGELIKIRIGLVTGDNSFFVINKEKAESHGMDIEFLKPILGRFNQVRGLKVSTTDITSLIKNNSKCLLVSASDNHISEDIARYLEKYPKSDIPGNRTFNKRNNWHEIDDNNIPDGFISCVRTLGPILTINEAKVNCTNTMYRFWFIKKMPLKIQKQIGITLQSSFSIFSAELEGRSFGTGSLKLEPSDCLRLSLLLSDVAANTTKTFNQIDACLKAGDDNAARSIADEYLITNGLITRTEAKSLSDGINELRNLRQGSKR